MKNFTLKEISHIKAMVRIGKTQYQIARALHTQKQNVATYLKAVSLGVRAPKTADFWSDVKAIKQMGEGTRKEAIHTVKFFPKWLKKRTAKLSEADRIFFEEWSKLDRDMRAAKWSEGRGYPEGMSEKLREDYEDYWETPE